MTTVARRLASLIGTAGLLACSVGTQVGSFHPANEPGGAHVALRMQPGETASRELVAVTVEGELLAVRDTALLIVRQAPNGSLAPPAARVVLVPLRGIRQGEFPQLHGSPRIHAGRFEPAEALAQVRLVSRYPQGVSDELLQALLAVYQQTQLDVLVP